MGCLVALLSALLLADDPAPKAVKYFPGGFPATENTSNDEAHEVAFWVGMATRAQAEATKARGLDALLRVAEHSWADLTRQEIDLMRGVFLPMASSTSVESRRSAAVGLGCLPDTQSQKALVKLFADKDRDVVVTAVAFAAHTKDDALLPDLTAIAKNARIEPGVRAGAIASILKIGSKKSRAALVDLAKALTGELSEQAKQGIDQLDGFK